MDPLGGIDISAAASRAPSPERSLIDRFKNQTMSEGQIDKVAKDFESVFIAQMLAPMFEGVEVDEMFGGGTGEEMYRSLMIEEYGKIMAKSGGIGIADQVKAELLRLQEMSRK
jgi:Rod binding domain-containing protein